MRTVSSTDSVPSTATANRQPNGVSPKAYSPSAMVHLPTGGWTTKDAGSLKTSRSASARAGEDLLVGVLDGRARSPSAAARGRPSCSRSRRRRSPRGARGRRSAAPPPAPRSRRADQPAAPCRGEGIGGREPSREHGDGTRPPRGCLAARVAARPGSTGTRGWRHKDIVGDARGRRCAWRRALVLAGTPMGDLSRRIAPARARSSPAPTSSPPRTPAGSAGWPATSGSTSPAGWCPTTTPSSGSAARAARGARGGATVVLVTDAGMPA